MKTKKETVKTVNENGDEIVLDVRYPSSKVKQAANLVYHLAWQKLVDQGVKTHDQIVDILQEKKIWSQKQEDEKEALQKKIQDLGKSLLDRGAKKTKAQGRAIAIEIFKSRRKLMDLLNSQSQMTQHSAESLAENDRFDYLVSQCVVYNHNGEPFFSSYEDYQERKEEKASWDVARKLAEMIVPGYNFAEDFEKDLLEIKFLKQHGFIDSEYRFVNKDGDFVDVDGNLLDNSNAETDVFGNKLDENGKPIVEFPEFLDDEE